MLIYQRVVLTTWWDHGDIFTAIRAHKVVSLYEGKPLAYHHNYGDYIYINMHTCEAPQLQVGL